MLCKIVVSHFGTNGAGVVAAVFRISGVIEARRFGWSGEIQDRSVCSGKRPLEVGHERRECGRRPISPPQENFDYCDAALTIT